MAWIKFEKDLLTDPRVLRIARTLQARWKLYEKTVEGEGFEICNDVALPAVTLVCGGLVRIWSLADTHLGEDDILPLGFEELDEVVGIPGFCLLLPEDWIVEVDEGSVKLPDFHAHNGTEAKKKAVTQKRVERFRERNNKALPVRNAPALPDQTRPDQTNKTNTLSDKSDSTSSSLKKKKSPSKLGFNDLVTLGVEEQVAKDWLTTRKSPLTKTVLKDLEREAAKAGLSIAEAVGMSAARGWRGFRAEWALKDSTVGGKAFSGETI